MRLSCVLLCLALGLLAEANPASAGPPFVTDDPVPVDYKHFEINVFSTATRMQGQRSGFLPGIEVNYGAVENLQLHVIAPLAFDQMDAGAAKFGYGDTELGAKYRFIDPAEDDPWPQIGVFPTVEVPSGNAQRGTGAGHPREYLPVWLQKDFGAWTTYGGGGYWINPGAGNRNYWFFGWLLQRQVTDDLALGGEVFHQTANLTTGRAITGFNLGGIYDVTEHYHLLVSAGRGLLNVAASNDFSYYVALQLTF